MNFISYKRAFCESKFYPFEIIDSTLFVCSDGKNRCDACYYQRIVEAKLDGVCTSTQHDIFLKNYILFNCASHRKYIKLLKSYLSFVHHKW